MPAQFLTEPEPEKQQISKSLFHKKYALNSVITAETYTTGWEFYKIWQKNLIRATFAPS